MKVAIVANCQARPLSNVLTLMSRRIAISGVVVTHLTKTDREAADYELLTGADVILAQLVQSSYPVQHVRMQRLREAFGGRVVGWPNLYFIGQCPSVAYVTTAKGGRISGPLRDYQVRPLYEAWRKGIGVAEAVAALRAEPGDVARRAARSLAELAKREDILDVKISDVIADEWRDRRLFFTFNHPSAHLLVRLCERLLARIGAAVDLPLTGALVGEALGAIVPPIFAPEARKLGLRFHTSEACRGVDVETQAGRLVLAKPRIYALEALAEATYRALDLQPHAAAEVRITPL